MESLLSHGGLALRCWSRLIRTASAILLGPGATLPTLDPCDGMQVDPLVGRTLGGFGVALCWTALYKGIEYLCFSTKDESDVEQARQRREKACRTVGVIHAVSVCVLAFVSNLVLGPWAYTSVGMPNTALQTFILSFCFGYFLFDLGWCLIAGGETWLMFAHHVASLASCGSGLILGSSGSELVGSLFGAEVTNPILQLRWFMLEAGKKGTKEVMYAELGFAATFLVCRVLWAPTLLFVVLRSDRPHWFVKAGGSALQLISWAWSVTIVNKLLAKLRGKGDSEKSSRAKED